jgi:hypothetical protein
LKLYSLMTTKLSDLEKEAERKEERENGGLK